MANVNKTQQQHEVVVSAEARQAISEFKKVAEQFKGLDKAASTTSNKMEAFKGVLGALALGTMVNLTKASIDAADAFNDMSARTGIAASTLTSYQLAAKMSGTSVEDIGRGLAKLSKTMQGANTGSKENAQAFASLGVSYLDASGKMKTSEQMMLDVAEVFKTMPDGVFKTTAAMSLFGKAGVEMIPFLNQGKDGIAAMKQESEDLGITLSEKTLSKINDFNDALDKSGLIAKNGLATVVSDSLPALTQLAEVFNLTAGSILKTSDAEKELSADKFDWMYGAIESLGLVGDAFQAVKNFAMIFFELVKAQFVLFGSVVARVAVAIDSLGRGDFKSAIRAFDGFGQQVKETFIDIARTADKQFTEERFSKKLEDSLKKVRQVKQKADTEIKKDFESGNAELKKAQDAGIKILDDSIKKQEEIYNKAKSLRDKSLEDTKSLTKEFDKLVSDTKKNPADNKTIGYDDVVKSLNSAGSSKSYGNYDEAIQKAKDTVETIKQAYENNNIAEYDRDRYLDEARQTAIDASKAKEAMAANEAQTALTQLESLKASKVELEKPLTLVFDAEKVTSEAEKAHGLIQSVFDKTPIKLTKENALGAQPAGFNATSYKDSAVTSPAATSSIILNFPGGGQSTVNATAEEAANLQNIVNRENLKAGL